MRVFVFACLASLLVAPTALLGTPLHAARRPQVLAQEQTTPDIDSIMSVPSSSFRDYRKGRIRRGHAGRSTFSSGSSNETTLPPWNCTTSPILTWGDVDNNTINSGVTITNGDTEWRAFFMYHNRCDYSPWKYIWISPGATRFVSLPALFEGRVVRGSDEWNLGGIPRPLGTWLELALDGQRWIWGDVSLIRGCDGAVAMWATDSSGAWKGFVQWILDGAPPGAYDTKPSGAVVLKATEDWNGSTDPIPRDWEMLRVGAEYVYVDDEHGSPVITSTNGRFGTYWAPGRI